MADPKPSTTERPSLRNRVWRLRNEKTVGAMASGENLLRYVLRRRGLEGSAAAAFLNSRVSAEMPDPYVLKDMDKVVNRLADAVQRREKVGIFGDYDVDGATSTAIMLRYLHFVGLDGCAGPEAIYHIPHRIVEGYGPNAPSLLRMQTQGCTVIICLDSGTTAFEPLDAATKAGIDMLVVDHHAAKPKLPNVIGVVNPNRLDEKDGSPGGQFGYMCAAGLTFMTVYALNNELKKRGFFKGSEAPRLTRLLQLAALGTVADVVPLVGLNRALVTMGLKVMNEAPYIGIFKMAETARMAKKAAGAKIEMDDPYEFDAYSCGFLFGPRINAGGRIADQLAGAKLLSINDEE
jgi:single-stranded-DNA-specific exonuclease